MTFAESLKREAVNELLVANHIAAKSGGLIQAKGPGLDKEKDFVLLLPQPIEVKFDYKAEETGNMFFETGCLSSTKAAVWYHFVPPCWLISYDPSIMLSHLRKHHRDYKFVEGAGGGNSSGVIVPVSHVKAWYFVETEEWKA